VRAFVLKATLDGHFEVRIGWWPHIHRRIAILGLLGTAALAVAMMAAPLLFADLPRWLLGIFPHC
jgi:hypothetical protein